MSRATDGFLSYLWVSLGIARAAASDVSRHWVMASFSLVAGFGVWFAIQDVENPSVTEVVTFDGPGLQVEARNVPDNYLFEGATVSQVRVQARERDLEELTTDDFEAWVDLSNFDPQREARVEVEVTSLDDDVRAIETVPPDIVVRLVPAVEKPDVQVYPNLTGSLPEGFSLAEDPEIEPGFVTLVGTQQQIDSIARVEMDVSLNGRREAETTVAGNLVARSSTGSVVTVQIEPPRAEVTLRIEQNFSQRTLPVSAPIEGHPAPGYRTGVVTYEPENVLVSGLKSVMDNLDAITLEPVDISGATSEVQVTRQIRIQNTAATPTTVVVRVEIVRDECNLSDPSIGCRTANVPVAVNFESQPPGLTVVGVYTAEVFVTGSFDAIESLNPEDFTAVVSLAGATAGTAQYDVSVEGPPGIRITSVEPVSVTLR